MSNKPGHHNTAEWKRVVAKAKPYIAASLPSPCVDCGYPVDPELGHKWQVGHIMPAALGGSDDLENLGPTHSDRTGPGGRSCNQSAGGQLSQAMARKANATEDKRLLPW